MASMGIDPEFSVPEVEEALRLVAPVCEDVLAPNAATTDRAAQWPGEALARLRAAGLGGLVVPRTFGGMGLGLYALARVCERLGRDCASTALCYGMHCVGAAVIAAKSTPAHEERFLRAIAGGQHLTTLSLSEAGTGAQFYLPETRVTREAHGGWRIDGEKSFVTNGGHADSYVISAVHADEQAPAGHFSCAVLPADTPGIGWGGPWDGIGMRGNSSRTMRLDGVRLTPELMLGEEGDQIWYVFHVIAPFFLVAMAGTYLGIAAAALEEARSHLSGRRVAQTGRGLAELAVIQSQFGELWIRVERARALVSLAALAGDAADPAAVSAIMASKVEAAAAAVDVANDAMTLVGGIGYRGSSTLHRLLRDARAGHVMSPTTNLLRLWIGRIQLGQPILGD